jgi:nitroimidazol reductase NimA-like FMN-containing flavoprotein (pyridoxamine 5'-phosphate oxidase superfamily)
MPAPDRTISEKEAIEILRAGRYGVLSTASADGQPYGVPVNYCYAEKENSIFFHCARVGKKIENLTSNNRVSFVVVGYEDIIPERFITHYESVVVSGKASFVTDEAQKRIRLIQLCQKFAPEVLKRREEVIDKYLPAVAICEISFESLTGKRNNDD